MRGYVKVSQWHSVGIKHLDDLKLENHKGDAKSIDALVGFKFPEILETQPSCLIGEVVFEVEDDGSLQMVACNIDSSG